VPVARPEVAAPATREGSLGALRERVRSRHDRQALQHLRAGHELRDRAAQTGLHGLGLGDRLVGHLQHSLQLLRRRLPAEPLRQIDGHPVERVAGGESLVASQLQSALAQLHETVGDAEEGLFEDVLHTPAEPEVVFPGQLAQRLCVAHCTRVEAHEVFEAEPGRSVGRGRRCWRLGRRLGLGIGRLRGLRRRQVEHEHAGVVVLLDGQLRAGRLVRRLRGALLARGGLRGSGAGTDDGASRLVDVHVVEERLGVLFLGAATVHVVQLAAHAVLLLLPATSKEDFVRCFDELLQRHLAGQLGELLLELLECSGR
jgi:hypothetical protein